MSATDPTTNAAAEGRPTREAERHVHVNVETIAAIVAKAEQDVDRAQRIVEKVARHLGQPLAAYIIVLAIVGWVLFNTILIVLHRRPVDPPPFFWMQGAVSIVALLSTLVVLITQNRQGHRAERQSHLELQINLRAEQKITKLIQLVEELRRDIPTVHNRVDALAESMSRSADPHQIIGAIERLEHELDKPAHR